MRHWFRTTSRRSHHPEGKPGLLQIYLFRNKAKKSRSRLKAVQEGKSHLIEAGRMGVPDDRRRSCR
jgi:hypothetical protein